MSVEFRDIVHSAVLGGALLVGQLGLAAAPDVDHIAQFPAHNNPNILPGCELIEGTSPDGTAYPPYMDCWDNDWGRVNKINPKTHAYPVGMFQDDELPLAA